MPDIQFITPDGETITITVEYTPENTIELLDAKKAILYRSADDGVTWTEVKQCAYP